MVSVLEERDDGADRPGQRDLHRHLDESATLYGRQDPLAAHLDARVLGGVLDELLELGCGERRLVAGQQPRPALGDLGLKRLALLRVAVAARQQALLAGEQLLPPRD